LVAGEANCEAIPAGVQAPAAAPPAGPEPGGGAAEDRGAGAAERRPRVDPAVVGGSGADAAAKGRGGGRADSRWRRDPYRIRPERIFEQRGLLVPPDRG
jgi:hypothetical protein